MPLDDESPRPSADDESRRPSAGQDAFSRQLAAYDDALAAGSHSPAVGILEQDDPTSELQLRGAAACLRLLEQKWPRSGRGENCALRNGLRSDPLCLLWTSESTAASRFQLKRKLGEGGHGVVFLAFDVVLERDVALELPRPEARVGHCREASLSARVAGLAATRPSEPRRRLRRGGRGPVLLHRRGILPGPDSLGLAEAAERIRSIRSWRRKSSGPWPARWPVRTAPVFCTATSSRPTSCSSPSGPNATAGRHWRPGTLWVRRSSRVGRPSSTGGQAASATQNRDSFDFTPKLADFGLAKHTESEVGQTETVTLAGTVPYMAPEQAAGRRHEIGFPTDVYALGVVLFELLTRRKPFEGEQRPTHCTH